ncbi:hypothetical protein AB4212_55780, partial [Streptomyces sp. 2MCAF27]
MPIPVLPPGIDLPGLARLPASTGPWAREYMAFNRRLALYGRAGVVSACAVLAVAAMPVGDMAPTAVAAVVALAWSWLHLRLATAQAMRPMRLLALDLAVMTALCLSQPLMVPDAQTDHR